MKKFNKVIGLFLVALLTFAVVGCASRDGNQKKVDSSKTQLFVNNFDGGFGEEWLNKAIDEFETLYAETEFEPNKKGVQVFVKSGKYTGTSLISQAKNSQDHIFISEDIYYHDYVSQGVMLDITDVVTTPLTEFQESNTIENKLESTQKEFLKTNNKYYAIPHYFACVGITYDVELFDKYNLYMDQNGGFTKKSTDSGLSLGGDGVPNTVDDGLPATYEDFYKLCNQLKVRGGNVPMIWSGAHQFYMTYLLNSLACETNGANNSKLMFTFNGTSDRVISSVNNDGSLNVGSKTIANANGYDAYAQIGYYYALDFMHNVIYNDYFDLNSFNEKRTHTDAQKSYLMSNRDPDLTPIGMLVEGNWWENEANPAFSSMENKYVNSKKTDRKFGFMPLPKATAGQIGEKHTMVESNLSYMFINSNISENLKVVAKKFISFLNTDAKLQQFTELTNTPKALNYSLTQENQNKMSYFGKSVFALKTSPTTDVIFQCSSNPMFYNNMNVFHMQKTFTYKNDVNPSRVFFDKKQLGENLTTKSYYETYIQTWKSKQTFANN